MRAASAIENKWRPLGAHDSKVDIGARLLFAIRGGNIHAQPNATAPLYRELQFPNSTPGGPHTK